VGHQSRNLVSFRWRVVSCTEKKKTESTKRTRRERFLFKDKKRYLDRTILATGKSRAKRGKLSIPDKGQGSSSEKGEDALLLKDRPKRGQGIPDAGHRKVIESAPRGGEARSGRRSRHIPAISEAGALQEAGIKSGGVGIRSFDGDKSLYGQTPPPSDLRKSAAGARSLEHKRQPRKTHHHQGGRGQ